MLTFNNITNGSIPLKSTVTCTYRFEIHGVREENVKDMNYCVLLQGLW